VTIVAVEIVACPAAVFSMHHQVICQAQIAGAGKRQRQRDSQGAQPKSFSFQHDQSPARGSPPIADLGKPSLIDASRPMSNLASVNQALAR